MSIVKWLHDQAGAHIAMRDGARQLGLLHAGREQEELEALLADVYRRGYDDGTTQIGLDAEEKK